MQTIVSFLYLFFLAVYIFLIFSIRSQINKYLLPNDNQSKNILQLLTLGAAVLILISVFLFFMVPWKDYELKNLMDILPQTDFKLNL